MIESEREKSLSNAKLNVTNNTAICQLHWLSNFDTREVHGKMHPKNPPSVWPVVPKSQIPTHSAVQRDIKNISTTAWNLTSDKMNAFFRIR